jgi:hypothetical protein
MTPCALLHCPLPASETDPLCRPHAVAAKALGDFQHSDPASRVYKLRSADFQRAVNTLIKNGAPVPERWL